MKDFQSVVEDLLHNHERHRRYVALLTVLCLLMSFTVSLILIEPAESRTGELICGQTQHVHTKVCKEKGCDQPVHVHSQNCYTKNDDGVTLLNFSDEQTSDDDTADLASSSDFFTAWQNQVPQDAVLIPQITNVTATVNGNTYNSSDSIDVVNAFGDTDAVVTHFRLDYNIIKDYVTVENPSIYYQLPAGVKVTADNMYGPQMCVNGPDGPAGYYTIGTNGLIVIRYTKDYITKYLNTSDEPIDSYIEFDANVERADTQDGDRTIVIGNNDIGAYSFFFDFQSRTGLSMKKSGMVLMPETPAASPLARWEIAVSKYGTQESLEGYRVYDDSFPKDEIENGVAVVNGVSLIAVHPDGSEEELWPWDKYGQFFTEEGTGKRYFKFTSDVTISDTVKFVFTEAIDNFTTDYNDDFDMTKTNEAYLYAPDKKFSETDGRVYQANASVKLADTPRITKSAVADYEYQGSAKFEGEIEWSIDVKHPYGTSLNGYAIIDEAFADVFQLISVTTTNVYGEIIPLEFSTDYEWVYEIVEQNDGSRIQTDKRIGLRLVSDNASNVRVVYTTQLGDAAFKNNTKTIRSKAELVAPSGIASEEKLKNFSHEIKKTYERQIVLNKINGEYNYDTREITWSIGAHVKTRNAGITLDGYTITNKALAYLDWNTAVADINAVVSEDDVTFSITPVVTENGVKFEFTGYSKGTYIEVVNDTLTVHGNIWEFNLVYETLPDGDKVESDGTERRVDASGDTIITNTVSDKYGDVSQVELNITSKEKAEVVYLGSEGLEESQVVAADSTENTTGKLNWQINLFCDEGLNGYHLTDTVTSRIYDGTGVGVNTSGAANYINAESIVIEAAAEMNGEYIVLEPETDYTISFISVQENAPYRFTVAFNDSTAEYRYAHVSYSSTVEMDAPTEENWKYDENGEAVFVFGNKANTEKIVYTEYFILTNRENESEEEMTEEVNKPAMSKHELQVGAVNSAESTSGNDGIMKIAGGDVPDEGWDGYFSSFNKGSAYDLSDGITGVTGTATGPVRDNSVAASFTMAYQVEAGGISKDQPYVYYQLDSDVLSVTNPPLRGPVYDGNYDANNNICGYYEITEDGLIVIRFTDDYLDAKSTDIAENGLRGTIGFDGTVTRSADNDGDQDVSFGDKKVTFEFPPNELDVTKIGSQEKETSGSKTTYKDRIKWQITVNDPSDISSDLNLCGYVLEDEMFAEADGNIEFEAYDKDGNKITDLSKIGSWQPNDSEKKYFEFNDNAKDVASVTFTFYTKIDKSDREGTKTIKNEATLKKGDESKKKDASVTIKSGATIEKSGTPDYRVTDDATYGNKVGGKIRWQITLRSDYGESLDGYFLEDINFPADASDIKIVKPTSGVTLTKDATGKYKIEGDATEVVLQYWADAESFDAMSNNHNSATYDYPDNKKGDTVNSTASYKPYTLTKSSNLDNENKTITWTITIDNTNKAAQKIDNVELFDEMFEHFEFSSKEEFLSKVTVSPSDSVINGCKDTDGDGYIDTVWVTSSSFPITFTYTTDLTEMYSKDKLDDGVTVNNTAYLGEDGIYGSDDESVYYKPRNKFEKTLTGKSGMPDKGVVGTNVDDAYELSWNIHLVQDNGFAYTGEESSVIVDVISNDANSGAKHYMTKAQFEEMKQSIKASKTEGGDPEPLTEGTHFEIYDVVYADVDNETDPVITSFKIRFTDAVDTAGYVEINIDYNTTAYLAEIGADKEGKFTNKADYKDFHPDPSTSFKNFNPDNPVYDKYIITADGRRITYKDIAEGDEYFTRSLDDVPIIEFEDGEEYYVFTWLIETDIPLMEVDDSLPDGFTLIEDFNHDNHGGSKGESFFYNSMIQDGYIKSPTYIYAHWTTDADGKYWGDGKTGGAYYVDQEKCSTPGEKRDENGNLLYKGPVDTYSYPYNGENKIHFYPSNSGDYAVIFSAKIKVSELDKIVSADGYEISNIIKGSKDGIEYGEKETIEKVTPGSERALKKDYSTSDIINGRITYTVDFNPEAKTYANGDLITLVDTLTFDGLTGGNNLSDADRKLDNLNFYLTLNVYEVDENGERTPLLSGYWYTFEPKPGGAIAAVLTLNVPDSKHLQFEYTYDVVHNMDYEIQDSGLTDSRLDGAIVELSNTVSVNTRMVTDSASKNKAQLELHHSNATANTFPNPKIEKVNIADYLTDDLEATFYLARYVPADGETPGHWEYAKKITESGTMHSIYEPEEESEEESDWVDNSKSPKDITANELEASYPEGKIETNDADYEIDLKSGTLYALLEVVAPVGYEQVNTKPIVHYFVYGAQGTYDYDDNPLTDMYPDGIDPSLVDNIQTGGTVYVPNNRVISVAATKTWNDNASIGSGYTVKLKLYWSYDRMSDTSFPPSGDDIEMKADGTLVRKNGDETETVIAQPVEYEDNLIVDKDGKVLSSGSATFNEVTLQGSTVKKTWQYLLNGKDGKPIYYYVMEESYTYDGKIYVYDPKSGDYVNEEGTHGSFHPVYSNNGVNNLIDEVDANGNVKSKTETVTVANYNKLKFKKLWVDAAGKAKTAPLSQIKFKLWGIIDDANGNRTYYPIEDATGVREFTLKAGSNWAFEITSDKIKDYHGVNPKDPDNPLPLTSFSNFYVEEILTEEQQKLLGDDYKFSFTYYGTDGTGLIEMTNKDTTPLKTKVEVEKLWANGVPKTEIDVVVYRSTIPQEDLGEALAAGAFQYVASGKLTEENGWKLSWELDYRNLTTGETYYYYVRETTTGDFIASYEWEQLSQTNMKTTITNSKKGKLKVVKTWHNLTNPENDGPTITFNVKRRIKGTDDEYVDSGITVTLPDEITKWEKTFDVPITDADDQEYEYLIEEQPVPDYKTTYGEGQETPQGGLNPDFLATGSVATVEVTNEEVPPLTGLNIQKVWQNNGGTPDESAVPDGLDSIVVKVMRRLDPDKEEDKDKTNLRPKGTYDGYDITTEPSSKTLTVTKGLVSGHEKYNILSNMHDDVTNEQITTDNLVSVTIEVNKDPNYAAFHLGKIGEEYDWTHWFNLTEVRQTIDVKDISKDIEGICLDVYDDRQIVKLEFNYEGGTPTFKAEIPDEGKYLYYESADNYENTQIKLYNVKTKEADGKQVIDGTLEFEYDHEIISIDEYGVITPLKSGTTDIIAIYNGERAAPITVTVLAFEEEVMTVTLYPSGENDGIWLPTAEDQILLRHLPMTNGKGATYYYYIEEVFDNEDYDVKYKFGDSDEEIEPDEVKDNAVPLVPSEDSTIQMQAINKLTATDEKGDLLVKKEWVGGTSDVSSIKVMIYRSAKDCDDCKTEKQILNPDYVPAEGDSESAPYIFEITSTDWTLTVHDLPLKCSHKQPYTYRVQEVSPTPEFVATYSTSVKLVKGDEAATFTITNTKIEEGNLIVTKKWFNSQNQPITSGIPVDTIDVYVYRTIGDNGKEEYIKVNTITGVYEGVAEVEGDNIPEECKITITSNDSWTRTLSKLPLTDELGNPYTYYIKEASEINGFDSQAQTAGVELSKEETKELKVTNTQLANGSLVVEKVWVHADDKEDSDMSDITVYIYKEDATGRKYLKFDNGVYVSESPDKTGCGITLSDPGWKQTLTGLPQDDTVYYIEEDSVPGFIPTYSSDTESFKIGGTATVTNTQINTGKLKLTKAWQDSSGEKLSDAEKVKLPDSITLKITRYTSKNVLDTSFGTNGELTITIKKDDGWEYKEDKLDNLPIYDNDHGKFIYHIEEVTGASGFVMVNTPTNVELNDGTETDKTFEIINKQIPVGDLTVEKKWQNRSDDPVTTDLPADGVTVRVYRMVENGSIKEYIEVNERYEYTGAGTLTGTSDDDKYNIQITGTGSTWQTTLKNLPFTDSTGNEYIYYIVEVGSTPGFEVKLQDTTNGVKLSEPSPTLTVINEQIDEGNLIIKKLWKDSKGGSLTTDENYDNITVRIYRLTSTEQKEYIKIKNEGSRHVFDGTSNTATDDCKVTILNPRKATDIDTWQVIVEGLPIYDGATRCTYYVEEVGIPDGFTVQYQTDGVELNSGTTNAEITITNNEIPIGSLTIEKLWYDSSDKLSDDQTQANAKVPTKIDVTVYRKIDTNDECSNTSPELVKELEITSNNGVWQSTEGLTELPLWDEHHHEYIYYVEEMTVEGFKVEYTENNIKFAQESDGNVDSETITITNTKIPTGDLEVEKKWQNSKGNQLTSEQMTDINLPQSITVKIYRTTDPDDADPTKREYLETKDFPDLNLSDTSTSNGELDSPAVDAMEEDSKVEINIEDELKSAVEIENYEEESKSEIDTKGESTIEADDVETIAGESEDAVIVPSDPKLFAITKERGWKLKLTGLPLNDPETNKPYTYYVEEVSDTHGFKVVYPIIGTQLSETEDKNITVINKQDVVGDLKVVKYWYDQKQAEYEKPADIDSITVRIYRKANSCTDTSCGEETIKNADGEETFEIKPDSNRNWELELKNLPLYCSHHDSVETGTDETHLYTYYVVELAVDEMDAETFEETGYEIGYLPVDGVQLNDKTVKNAAVKRLEITNTKKAPDIPKGDLMLQKIWQSKYGEELDNSSITVDTIEVQLYRKVILETPEGKKIPPEVEDEKVQEELVNTVTLKKPINGNTTWRETIRGLEVTDIHGHQYLYYVKEESVPGGYEFIGMYSSSDASSEINGTLLIEKTETGPSDEASLYIVNRSTADPTGSLEVIKKWLDSNGITELENPPYEVIFSLWRIAEESSEPEASEQTPSDTPENNEAEQAQDESAELDNEELLTNIEEDENLEMEGNAEQSDEMIAEEELSEDVVEASEAENLMEEESVQQLDADIPMPIEDDQETEPEPSTSPIKAIGRGMTGIPDEAENVNVGKGSSTINGVEVYTFSITDTEIPAWTITLTNLPLKDEQGHDYIYYLWEEKENTAFEVTITTNEVKLNSKNPATITVTNKKVESSAQMPSTGGFGTRGYTLAGIAIIGGSLTAYTFNKRRSRRKRVIPR